jgi:adenylosuccinate synthase
MKKAQVVIGLQFGDEGKGKTVDYLCSRSSNPIVVRFSGGQQAGHTVIHNGIKHIHSNFGSGTLRGVPSYFSEHCTIYPVTMYNEKKVLNEKKIYPNLIIHPLAKVTTPYDVIFNRMREKEINHGSCGLGVGATMTRNDTSPYKLYAVDLQFPVMLYRKLDAIKKWYLVDKGWGSNEGFMRMLDVEMKAFDNAYQNIFFTIEGYDCLKEFDEIIFEGSQGVLLDMDHGVFPNVTYANTTSKNALEICKYLGIQPEIYYITRCYQTRHGAGYMTNEGDITLTNNEEEINVHNEWQKHFRTGELDYNLLNYSLKIDNIYSSGLDKHLVTTCLDQRPGFNVDYKRIYSTFKSYLESFAPTNSFYELYGKSR